MELRYIRDTDKREVDFIVLQNKLPLFAVECKVSEKNISPHIKYFSERTTFPKFYQVHMEDFQRQISDKIIILPFLEFCKIEKMV
jgi:predicted AAA+ superfamily ATPase